MNKTVRDQLDMLKTLDFQVDGRRLKEIPESFSNIIFLSNSSNKVNTSVKIFTFADYIIKPFDGFDFHDKFNKGVITPFKVMEGDILKETDKMYYITCKPSKSFTKVCMHCLKYSNNYLCEECSKLYKNLDDIIWTGWVPKKSVKVEDSI